MLRILGGIFVGGAAGIACGSIILSFCFGFINISFSQFLEYFLFIIGNFFIIGAVFGICREWKNYWADFETKPGEMMTLVKKRGL
jgi:hypothetical protein